jgi:F-type H+-transporting ATPase subunit b
MTGVACETPRKLESPAETRRATRFSSVFAVLLLTASIAVLAHTDVDAIVSAQADAAQGAEDGGRGLVDVVARIVNFGILAGTLFYLLRSPLRNYLAERTTQIRKDLVNAAEMKRAAAAQIEDIDRKMKALPGELEALRVQGAQEIAAEEARILAAAAAERDRLLVQARREIDLQAKVAERELVAQAADLAVGVASERIRATITDDDQKRLLDRYVNQLKGRA